MDSPSGKHYSVTEAAKILKISRQRIHQLIKQGRLEAKRVGEYWVLFSLNVSSVSQKN